MKKISGSKAVLKRAKLLLASDKISDVDLVELSVLMNEYIDFLNDFKKYCDDDVYIEKEEKLRIILSTYCDNVEESFIEKREIRGMRY